MRQNRQEWSVQFERGRPDLGKFRYLINNATEPLPSLDSGEAPGIFATKPLCMGNIFRSWILVIFRPREMSILNLNLILKIMNSINFLSAAIITATFLASPDLGASVTSSNTYIDLHLIPKGLYFRRPISESEIKRYSCTYRIVEKQHISQLKSIIERNSTGEINNPEQSVYYTMLIEIATDHTLKRIIFDEKSEEFFYGKIVEPLGQHTTQRFLSKIYSEINIFIDENKILQTNSKLSDCQ